MNRNSNIAIGAGLIALGTLFLLSNLGYMSFSWNYIWPLALLVPGLYMHFVFFTGIDKNAGILVPGGILTTFGLIFYANVLWGWDKMGMLWPLFPIGIAIGLFELYIFGRRDKGLLIPVVILGGIGLTSLMKMFISFDLKNFIIPIVLIIIGIAIIFGRKNGNNNNGNRGNSNPN